MATSAALSAFRRIYADPGALSRSGEADDRLADYRLLWSYYSNSAFDALSSAWQSYRAQNRLYRGIRPIYNPARRLAEFYAGVIYQGEWGMTPASMVQKSCAIPLGEDTPPALLAAIAQMYQWSNWQSKKSLMLRYGAAVGDCLIVIVDDIQRRKIYPDVIWPGNVASISTDATGNVVAYTLEYDVLDPEDETRQRTYTYRREVDKVAIVEYADDSQVSYAPNPYGFTPACWVQHAPGGSVHGQPALRNIGKMDELNALAAHALDQAHRILEAPILLSGSSVGGNLGSQAKAGPAGPAGYPGAPRLAPASQEREELKIIVGGENSDIKTVRLDPGEAVEHIDRLLKEIEQDHPELGMWQSLRQMSQVTGPAADRLFGDVAALVNAARAQYDQQTIKMLQMCTAIGGWRANSGAWGLSSQLSRQQRAFLPFGLESYANGELDLTIQSRGLVLNSPEEELRLEQMRQSLAADRAYADAPGAAQGMPAAIVDRLRQAAASREGGEV